MKYNNDENKLNEDIFAKEEILDGIQKYVDNK